MFFKLTYSVCDLHFARKDDAPIVCDYEGKNKICIIIRTPTKQEGERGHITPFIEATCQREPNQKVLLMFEALSKNQIPEFVNYADRPHYISETGSIEKPYAVSMDFMPEPFQSYANDIQRELHAYGSKTLLTYRWVQGIPGRHNPFAFVNFEWSFDNRNWHGFPYEINAHIMDSRGLQSDADSQSVVLKIVSQGESEPLAHELYREACSQLSENPRSSLILGIVAAESAVKHCIAELHPQTDWLIENIPSPDVIKLLRDYFPKLPTKNSINGKVQIPLDLMSAIKDGVQMRNKVAHGGVISLKREKLEEILKAVHELLYLIDFYCGHNWALNRLEEDTLLALGVNL